MSRLQSGNNSYPNGTYRQPNEGSYGGSYRGSYHDRSSTRGRERRAGGYGGFYANSGLSELGDVHSQDRIPSENVNTSHAPTFSDRQAPEWHSESRKKERDAVQNGASVYGSGPAGRQIESVIDHITEKWEVMLGEDCVPVQLSLQLMDHSSLGRGSDYQDFQRTSKRLQNALRSIVNGILALVVQL
ncbi:MAG: hypothetical protein LQ342_000677 [Letrouitia transgressa]|nr:MAG: hypothetical protein LQ342_000677 [Letrouitia transgressa]